MLDADGEVVAVAGTTRDVTARQAAEQIIREHAERLGDADRAKDEFLATLSHELRNPLAPLKNGVEILRRTTDGNSIHAEIHSMMERQVDHLVRLVDDLMEGSRITRGKISLQLQAAELGAIVSNALDAARPMLEAGRHALHVDQPAAPVHLLADPVRLTQILANLLNNAAKYSPPGSDIRLAVRRRDDALTVSVSDTGMGMEPAEIPHLFEMFTRGDRVRTSHQGGLGIGLALSRRLAMLHGGSLDAHSEGPGRGSTFTLELPGPFVDPTERAPTAIPEELRLSLRVLVADDNRDAGSSLADALQLFGAQVHVVDDGADALEQFESLAPDVAILDIGMPRVTGYDVAQALRGRDVQVPLIALTGWGQASDRDRAIAAGFDHHLVKPVAIPSLVRLLASLERGERTSDTRPAESSRA
ncbi:MAG: hypothetical protein A2579_09275 [Lysobacterales bacterium RIFOXYD1_FULL_69_11]|nr:MAG: hypothetical protein A2579_09275 [Xanthomonadales bacterium RIFOXYD1_FULL_69_11]